MGASTFATPEEAADALFVAAATNDTQALIALFGEDTEDLVVSGDDVADRDVRDRFATAYQRAHTLVADGEDTRILQIGYDQWPVPLPIVQRDGLWSFDAVAGLDEIIFRRIGRNELGAIETLMGMVASQQEYAAASRGGVPAGTYAARFFSEPGTHNGLYWPAAEGERPSPLGPYAAEAAAEGYAHGAEGKTKAEPYHGYLFRMLTAQGQAADGGAMSYVVDGRLSGGFGIVAFPVEYGVSGIMTFIVNQDGVVYQRDLGGNTLERARAIRAYNPDSNWTPVEQVE
jgi:hypothetical protein